MHQPVLAKTFITFAGLILAMGKIAFIDRLQELLVTGFVIEPKTKSMNRIILLLITILAVACSSDSQPEGKGEKSLEEIKSDGPIRNADIIRNPVSADTPIDTVNVAKIAFEDARAVDVTRDAHELGAGTGLCAEGFEPIGAVFDDRG